MPPPSKRTSIPLAELIAEVEKPAGRKRLIQHLTIQPFPHYEPAPGGNFPDAFWRALGQAPDFVRPPQMPQNRGDLFS